MPPTSMVKTTQWLPYRLYIFKLFKVSERSKTYLGCIVTAPGKEVDFVSLFFAPPVGINEDQVTGSAHCTLIPYWSKRLKKKELLPARFLHGRRTALF